MTPASLPTAADYRNAWCEVDLDQFDANLHHLFRWSGSAGNRPKKLLVVKANGYGHGLVEIATRASEQGSDMLGVATIGEAEQLIDVGIKTPILIICPVDSTEIEYCVAHGVHFMAWRTDQFEVAVAAGERFGTAPKIHLEVDTGMSRSGVEAGAMRSLLESLPAGSKLHIVGACTHFFAADEADTASADRQLDAFLASAGVLRRWGATAMLHTANSPATLRMPQSRLDMVRLGVIAYGLPPSDHVAVPDGVAPLLTWKARITDTRTIPAGRGVTYGWEYVAPVEHRVATFGVGYADGYRRTASGVNSVLLHGVEVPVVGRVCMDQCVVLLPDDLACAPGDVAVLLGRQGSLTLDADHLAARWNTNNYDVVAGIRDRVPRRYVRRG